MTSPNAQINIKQSDLLPSISFPDDGSAYAILRRSIQGWRWHPVRCLSPLHSGPGAPVSCTHWTGHCPSPVFVFFLGYFSALIPQHHWFWMISIAMYCDLNCKPSAAPCPVRINLIFFIYFGCKTMKQILDFSIVRLDALQSRRSDASDADLSKE